jgi:hypothetical protein
MEQDSIQAARPVHQPTTSRPPWTRGINAGDTRLSCPEAIYGHDTEDAMHDLRNVESLLEDAIELLEENRFPLAAESLRNSLRAISGAPTAAARRRRVFQLRDLFDGVGSTLDVFFCDADQGPRGLRFRQTDVQRRRQERYRHTLEAIQAILAFGSGDETLESGWPPELTRVA